MKQVLLATVFGVALASSAFAADSNCTDFAKNMAKKAVVVFHDTGKGEEQKRSALHDIFQEAVDTDWIGKFVLARFWKTASNEEQTQYLKYYRTYITKSYVSKFNDEDGMSVDDIVVASVSPREANQFDAKTLIKRKGQEDVSVDYLLDQTGGKCHVHDIKVEGVSLLTSQRSEFGAIASSSGVKGVIDALSKQISN